MRRAYKCIAFRALGHLAFSADLQPCRGGHPEWHIEGDVTPFLRGLSLFMTCDGKVHHLSQFDLIYPRRFMIYNDFRNLVAQMREAQKEYFRTRSRQVLQRSIMLEKLVDAELQSNELSLF